MSQRPGEQLLVLLSSVVSPVIRCVGAVGIALAAEVEWEATGAAGCVFGDGNVLLLATIANIPRAHARASGYIGEDGMHPIWAPHNLVASRFTAACGRRRCLAAGSRRLRRRRARGRGWRRTLRDVGWELEAPTDASHGGVCNGMRLNEGGNRWVAVRLCQEPLPEDDLHITLDLGGESGAGVLAVR